MRDPLRKAGLGGALRGFLKMTGHFSGSAVYLAEHGYTDEYMSMLRTECEGARKASDKAEGQALTAQAHMYRGELKQAAEEYENTDISKLGAHFNSVFLNNFILCLFLLKRFSRITELYEEHNSIILAENTLVMRRTIGIREYTEKRYENAVTVFIKLLEEPDPRATLMADICLVRSLLALDMRDRAKEIADIGFSRYSGRGDVTAEVNRLRMKINEKKKPSDNKNKRKK